MNYSGNMPDWHQYNQSQVGRSTSSSSSSTSVTSGQNGSHMYMPGGTSSPGVDGINLTSDRHRSASKHHNETYVPGRNYPGISTGNLPNCVPHYGANSGLPTISDESHRNSQIPYVAASNANPAHNSLTSGNSYVPCKAPCCMDPNLYQPWEKFPHYSNVYRENVRPAYPILENNLSYPDNRRNYHDYQKYGRKESVPARNYPTTPNLHQNYSVQNYQFSGDYQKCPYTGKDFRRPANPVASPAKTPANPMMKYHDQQQSVIVQSKYQQPKIQYQNSVPECRPTNLHSGASSSISPNLQNSYFDYCRDYSQDPSVGSRISQPGGLGFQKYHVYHQKMAMQRFSLENHLRAFSRVPGYQTHPKYQECVMRYRELLRLQQTLDCQNVVQETPKVPPSPSIAPINLQFDQNGVLINSSYVPCSGSYGNSLAPGNSIVSSSEESESTETRVENYNGLHFNGAENSKPVERRRETEKDNFTSDKRFGNDERFSNSQIRYISDNRLINDENRLVIDKNESPISMKESNVSITSKEAKSFKNSKDFADKPELDVRQFLANWDESEDENLVEIPQENEKSSSENAEISKGNQVVENSIIECVQTEEGLDGIPTIHIVENVDGSAEMEKIQTVFGNLASAVLEPISICEENTEAENVTETIVLVEPENSENFLSDFNMEKINLVTEKINLVSEKMEVVQEKVDRVSEKMVEEKMDSVENESEKSVENLGNHENTEVRRNSENLKNRENLENREPEKEIIVPKKMEDSSKSGNNLRKQSSFASDESHNPDDISLPDLQTSECTPISTTLNTPIHSDSEESSEHVVDLRISTNPIEIIQNSPIISFSHSAIKMEPYGQLQRSRMVSDSETVNTEPASLDFDFDEQVASNENTKYNENCDSNPESVVEELENSVREARISKEQENLRNNEEHFSQVQENFSQDQEIQKSQSNFSDNHEHFSEPRESFPTSQKSFSEDQDFHENTNNFSQNQEHLSELRENFPKVHKGISSDQDFHKDRNDFSEDQEKKSESREHFHKSQKSFPEPQKDFSKSQNFSQASDNVEKDEDNYCGDPLVGMVSPRTGKPGKCDKKNIEENPTSVDVDFNRAEDLEKLCDISLDDTCIIPLISEDVGEESRIPLQMESNCLKILNENLNENLPIGDLGILENSEIMDRSEEIWKQMDKELNVSNEKSLTKKNSQKSGIIETKIEKCSKTPKRHFEVLENSTKRIFNSETLKCQSDSLESTCDSENNEKKNPSLEKTKNLEIKVANLNLKIQNSELEKIMKERTDSESGVEGVDAIEIKINLSRGEKFKDETEKKKKNSVFCVGKIHRERRRSMPENSEPRKKLSKYRKTKKRRSMDDELLSWNESTDINFENLSKNRELKKRNENRRFDVEKRKRETVRLPSPSYNSSLDSTLDFDNFDVAPSQENDQDFYKVRNFEERSNNLNSYENFNQFSGIDALERNLNTVPIYTTKDGRITYSPNRNYTYRALIIEARQRETFLRSFTGPRSRSLKSHEESRRRSKSTKRLEKTREFIPRDSRKKFERKDKPRNLKKRENLHGIVLGLSENFKNRDEEKKRETCVVKILDVEKNSESGKGCSQNEICVERKSEIVEKMHLGQELEISSRRVENQEFCLAESTTKIMPSPSISCLSERRPPIWDLDCQTILSDSGLESSTTFVEASQQSKRVQKRNSFTDRIDNKSIFSISERFLETERIFHQSHRVMQFESVIKVSEKLPEKLIEEKFEPSLQNFENHFENNFLKNFEESLRSDKEKSDIYNGLDLAITNKDKTIKDLNRDKAKKIIASDISFRRCVSNDGGEFVGLLFPLPETRDDFSNFDRDKDEKIEENSMKKFEKNIEENYEKNLTKNHDENSGKLEESRDFLIDTSTNFSIMKIAENSSFSSGKIQENSNFSSIGEFSKEFSEDFDSSTKFASASMDFVDAKISSDGFIDRLEENANDPSADSGKSDDSNKAPILSFSGQIQSDPNLGDSSKSPPDLSVENPIFYEEKSTKISSEENLIKNIFNEKLSPKIPPDHEKSSKDFQRKISAKNIEDGKLCPIFSEEKLPFDERSGKIEEKSCSEFSVVRDIKKSCEISHPKIPKMIIRNIRSRPGTPTTLEMKEKMEESKIPKMKIKLEENQLGRMVIETLKVRTDERKSKLKKGIKSENSAIKKEKFPLVGKLLRQSSETDTQELESCENPSYKFTLMEKPCENREKENREKSKNRFETQENSAEISKTKIVPKLTIKKSGTFKTTSPSPENVKKRRGNGKKEEKKMDRRNSMENQGCLSESQNSSEKIPKVIIKRSSSSAEFKCELSKNDREKITKDSKWQPEVKLRRLWVLDCMAKEPGNGQVALEVLESTLEGEDKEICSETPKKETRKWNRSSSDSTDNRERILKPRRQSEDFGIIFEAREHRRKSLESSKPEENSKVKCSNEFSGGKLSEINIFEKLSDDKFVEKSSSSKFSEEKLSSNKKKSQEHFEENSVIKIDSSDESQTTIEILPASPANEQFFDGEMGKIYSEDAIPTQFELELEIVDNSMDSMKIPENFEPACEENFYEFHPNLEDDLNCSQNQEISQNDLNHRKSQEDSDHKKISKNDSNSEKSSKDNSNHKKISKDHSNKKSRDDSHCKKISKNDSSSQNSSKNKLNSRNLCENDSNYRKSSKDCSSSKKSLKNQDIKKFQEIRGNNATCCSESLVKEVMAAKETLKRCLTGSIISLSPTKRSKCRPKTVAEKKQGRSFTYEKTYQTDENNSSERAISYLDSGSSKDNQENMKDGGKNMKNDKKHSHENFDVKRKNSKEEKKSYKIPKTVKIKEIDSNDTTKINNNNFEESSTARKTEETRKSPSPVKMPILEPQIDLNFELNRGDSDRDNSRSPPVITKQEESQMDEKKVRDPVDSGKIHNVEKQEETEVSFADIVSQLAYHEKATIRHRRYCTLCERWFPTAARHRRHLTGYQHRHTELTQRRTVHALFMLFTGKPCPRLLPASIVRTDCMPGEPTPLQIAVQDVAISLEDSARTKSLDVGGKDEE